MVRVIGSSPPRRASAKVGSGANGSQAHLGKNQDDLMKVIIMKFFIVANVSGPCGIFFNLFIGPQLKSEKHAKQMHELYIQ